MRLWRRKTRTEANDQSVQALESATQNLEKVKSRAGEVSEVAEALRRIRTENHFAESLTRIMGGNNTNGKHHA